ncbi:GPI mannosyltransferase 2, partial [Piptocephalis cylindrospora]
PLAMRLVASTLLAPLQGLVSPTILLLLAGACIANVSAVLASVALYLLGRRLTRSDQLARVAAFLFALTPSAAFLSAPYTESPFALLSFSGMLLHAEGYGTLAALTWSLTTTLRSNGILHAGFFLYELARRVIRHFCSTPSSFSSFGAWVQLIISSGLLLLRALIVFGPFVAIQMYGHFRYCSSPNPMENRSWCTTGTLPMIYSFVQDHYWNCGPFRYYTLRQLPNFLLASPFILLTGAGVWVYAKAQPSRRLITLGLFPDATHNKGRTDASGTGDEPHVAYASSKTLLPYVILWFVQVTYALITMHVQVILRFLTSQPALYLFASSCVLAHLQGPHRHLGGWAILHYFPLYNVVGIVLFAHFLPPA